MNNGADINERLQKMKKFYLKLDEMMDKLQSLFLQVLS